jgi:hypothetical protein
MQARASHPIILSDKRVARLDVAVDGWQWVDSLPNPRFSSECLDGFEEPLGPLSSKQEIHVSILPSNQTVARASGAQAFEGVVVRAAPIYAGPPPRAPLWKSRRPLKSGEAYPMVPPVRV